MYRLRKQIQVNLALLGALIALWLINKALDTIHFVLYHLNRLTNHFLRKAERLEREKHQIKITA